MSGHLVLFEGQPYISRSYLLKEACVPLGTVNTLPKQVEKRTLDIGLCYRYSTLPDSVTSRLSYASVEAARQAALGAQVVAAAEQAYHAHRSAADQLTYDLAYGIAQHWEGYVSGFTHERLTAAEAEPYARLQAALEWCLTYLAADATRTRRALLPAFQAQRLRFCPTPRPGSRTDGVYVSFCTKLSSYAAAPDKAAFLLVERGAQPRNRNRLELGPLQEDWLIERYAHPMKISKDKLYARYVEFVRASAPEWPLLSLRTVGKMLDENSARWYARRHGAEEGKKRLGYTQTKERTSRPNLLVEVDGTEEPFLFRDEQGKRQGNIYCVRAWDAYSGAIVGSSYGTSETGQLVCASMENYLLTHRQQPHQFRYDRGKANLSPVVQALVAAAGATSFPSQARRPTGRSSERLLGEFQYEQQYELPGFRGSNYRNTRNLNRKVHPDRLKKEWKNETRASIIARCRQAEEDWNNTVPASDPDGLTRLQRYQQGCLASGALSLKRLADLLCVERKRPVRYATSCLQIEGPDGTRHYFEPQLADGSVDFELHKQLVAERASLTVWELRDGSRELVIVRRADGTGEWLELRAKRIWTESLGDKTPGEQQALSKHWAAEKVYQQSLLATPATATEAADEAPAGAESWRLEHGPEGQDKDEWNAAEFAAISAEAGPETRPRKVPKRLKPTAPLPPETPPRTSWPLHDNRNGDGVEPASLGPAPSL